MMKRELGDRLAALSPEQIKALVSRLNKGAAGAGLRRVAREPGERHPLSSAQERLWFLAQLAPDSRVLNNPGALRARTAAPLVHGLFQRSLEEVGRRHEILRTTFHASDGGPVQVVHEHVELKCGWEDLTGLPEAEREAEAARIAAEEGRQVFDLSRGPLLTMKILHLGELDYMLLITSHHIVSDGWSMAMFSTEVASIYGALSEGRPHGIPEPEFQYVDYVYWEREWMRGEKFREQLDYWKRQFATGHEPLRLPADYERPRVKSDAGSIERLTLPRETAGALREFARSEGASLFHLMMTALGALLYRYTGQEDTVVGTSAANRGRREVQNVMGLFVNTLAVRTRVRGGESFRQYLGRVRETCREALLRQELPFEKLIEELNPPRSLNEHPLFRVMLVHQNVPALYVVPGMQLELLKVDYGTAKFDLDLWVEEMNDELVLTLHYSRDLFRAATARRILTHFATLLEGAARDPDRQVGRLTYLPREERELALRRAESAAESAAGEQFFHRRFEAQAARRPDAPAVESPGARLTYGELNSRANRLARHLRAMGVGAESVVALLAERGARALVGILGVLKAGAAYLPLDPRHPAARLAFLLQDARAQVLLTEEHFRPLAGELEENGASAAAIYLDGDWEEVERQSDENLDLDTDRAHLAYVIYTSGSTGVPKGVCVEQRNLINYCDAAWREMGLAEGDRFATVAPLAADLGHMMIFPPLANGGTVVPVPQELATDAAALSEYFGREPAECMKFVPSHLRALLDTGRAGGVRPAKLLVLGGEAPTADLVERLRDAGARHRVLNSYGPTETTVAVLAYEVPGHVAGPGALPTGFPLAGCKVYVLDAGLEPVPVGVAGEIYVGGECVARGYLNRPAQTAERFVPDPFGVGGRLYRTGDRARALEGGAVQFLGRADRQVKVRGFRVELAEIEAALQGHPRVEQAVVLPPDADADGARGGLTAFVTTRRGAGEEPLADAEPLKEYLRKTLPPHMLPGAFVLLDSMPLTDSGKVDYRELSRRRDATVREPPPTLRPPRDEIELGLLLIWQELLGVEGLGVTDNFFDAGGHSLLAIQLVSRVEARFGLRLPLASLFEFGTVEQLAALLRREKSLKPASPLVLIRKGTGRKLFFVHPAGGNVLCYYELARALQDGLEFYGVQAAPGENGGNGSAARASVETMARRYLDAVGASCAGEAPVFGGWSMGALVAFEMARLYASEHGRAPTVAVLDQPAPGTPEPRAAARDEQTVEDDELSRLASFSLKVSRLVGRDLGVSVGELSGMTPEGRAALFLERFKSARLVPEQTAVGDFRGFLDLMVAHNRVTSEYAPGVYAGEVLVFRAAEPVALDPGLREAMGLAESREPDLGWQKYSLRPVEVVGVPGSHITMVTGQNARTLAAELSARVQQRRELE